MESGQEFDFEQYIDALSARKLNLVMLWSFFATSAAHQAADVRIGYNAPEIWPWAGNPDDGTFDLTIHNQAYFDRLSEFVGYAESKDMVVLITVFDGWLKGSRWGGHPFNSSLGNGPLSNRMQFVELADYYSEIPTPYDPSWDWKEKNQFFQERFAAKLITELQSYSNVIYEIFNEGEWYDDNDRSLHEQHFLEFFRNRCDNVLISNSSHIEGDNPHNDVKVDMVSLHGGWTGEWGDFSDHEFPDFGSGFDQQPTKPYIFSEPVKGWQGDTDRDAESSEPGLDDIIRSVWETTLSGAGWVSQNDASFGWNPNAAIANKSENRNKAYDYAGYCAAFLNGKIDIEFFVPMGFISSTGIALGDSGNEYVVYSPEVGPVSVLLPDKKFYVYWLDPENGSHLFAGVIDGGNTVLYPPPAPPPYDHDLMLFFKADNDTSGENYPRSTTPYVPYSNGSVLHLDAFCHDRDNDGYDDCALGDEDDDGNPSDCNDTNAAINPDAEENCDNGVDDNCDGQVDECF
jgi:hypothetical protein